MALCSECKKNAAVVFINKIVDGKPNLEGLCLACAKKRGINPLASMMKQYGASEEEIENMNSQFDEIVESMQDIEIDPETMNLDGISEEKASETEGSTDAFNEDSKKTRKQRSISSRQERDASESARSSAVRMKA